MSNDNLRLPKKCLAVYFSTYAQKVYSSIEQYSEHFRFIIGSRSQFKVDRSAFVCV